MDLLKKGQYCLCRISVQETLAAHVTPPQSPASSPASSSFNLNDPRQQPRMNPIKRPCLILGIIGQEVGLLHVSSFNRKPRPEEFKEYYLPISPNHVAGEPSIVTTPAWKGNMGWQYCGYPKYVQVGKVSVMGPPTFITKSSMLDVIYKQEQLQPRDDDSTDPDQQKSVGTTETEAKGHCALLSSSKNEPAIRIKESGDLNDDLPLVFTPVVDFWVCSDVFAEMEEADYELEDEMNELGLLIDKFNNEISV